MLKLDAYKLKLIAIIGMILSHMVIAWWEIIPTWLAYPMYAVGGLTFPIMAYFVAQGYKHTRNLKRYVLRVLLFGLIALPFHVLTISIPLGGGNPTMYPLLNIMFNIATGLLVLFLYDKMKSRLLFWLLFIVIIVPLSMIFLEWYFIGVTMVLLSHILKNETAKRMVPSLFAAVSFVVLGFLSNFNAGVWYYQFIEAGISPPLLITPTFAPVQAVFPVGMVLAALLLKGYNNQRGRQMKWLFYVIYPVHFIVLLLGMMLIGTIM